MIFEILIELFLFEGTKQAAEKYLSKKRTIMPNDTKKKIADLTTNLNESTEIDSVSIGDDEMNILDEMDEEMAILNDGFAAENAFDAMVPMPNANLAECGSQTLAIQWCNVAAHRSVPSNAHPCDKGTQTIHSHNMATQTTLDEKLNKNGISTPTDQTCESAAQSEVSPLNLISTGTQTIGASSCNITEHQGFTSLGKYSQTEPIESSDAAIQTESPAKSNLEIELGITKKALKHLNSRLGDEMIESDSSSSSDSDSSLSREEENFSDASDSAKQFDNRFSLKYGFVTNVCRLMCIIMQHNLSLICSLIRFIIDLFAYLIFNSTSVIDFTSTVE